jgi:Ser/Thr protein kinase RdoA (MazF antagonist)
VASLAVDTTEPLGDRIPSRVKADLEQRLGGALGERVTRWSPIPGGTQNRLFRLDTASGNVFLAKLYHQDRWNRLQREFSALSLLGRQRVGHVPRAYLRCDEFGYGVYSFEPGRPRSAAELEAEDLKAVASVAAELQAVTPAASGEDLAPAVDASFSIAQHVQAIYRRLRAFETFASSPGAYDEVGDLCRELDVRTALADLIQRTTVGVDHEQQQATLPRHAWRLNTADFGPQNLLFTSDGQLKVVDFEASGWDDPARQVMGFVAHATSEDLTPKGVKTFLGAYAEACLLSERDVARYERVGRLLDLEWVAIYASALTGEAVATKEFASPDFERSSYLANAIVRLKRRLTRATEGGGYPFPTG